MIEPHKGNVQDFSEPTAGPATRARAALTGHATHGEPAVLAAARQLCHASPMPMMLWWQGQRAPTFNQALASCTEAAFGCSAAELAIALEPDVQQVLRTGRALELQDAAYRLPHRPGSSARQPCCLHPLQGEPSGTHGVLLIGTLAHMQARWRERMDYAAVIYAMDLGFCRVEMLEPVEGELRDYRFLETNPAYEEHSGLRGLVGRRITEVTEQREPFWPRAFESVLASGQTLHTTVTLRSTDQSFETWIMRLGGPGSLQLAVLLKNITAQVHAEQRLQHSEHKARDAARRAELERNRLAAMIEATPAAVLVVDRQQRTTLVNSTARQLWGDLRAHANPRWVGRWADGGPRHGQPLRGSQWPLVRALRGQTVREVLEIISPADGQRRGIYLVSAEPTRDPDKAIDGAVVVALDIGERVLAEQALKNASSRKDEFLAMLAHELRNPLAPIAMAAEMLGRADTAPESMADTSAVITRQVRHMRGLIDDLLDASRVSRGLIEIDSRELDLRPLVHEAIEQVRPMLQSLSHVLQLQLPAHRLSVRGDDKRLVQILSNLLHNAAKYTPAGGHIHLSAEIDADVVQVRVSDNGIGMDRRTLEHAFELFSQAERGVDRHQGGLGIGLALVKKLIDLHGGQVQAASAGPGCGSAFTVRLPRAQESQAMPEDADATAPARSATAPDEPNLKILVVDDNVDAARTLMMFLQACGHRCEVAHDGQQALLIAQRQQPQVFILDIGLPGMDGRQLARQLRQDPASRGARILALSGYAQPQEQEAALAAGFDHYLVKPVDVEQLLGLLKGSGKAAANG